MCGKLAVNSKESAVKKNRINLNIHVCNNEFLSASI